MRVDQYVIVPDGVVSKSRVNGANDSLDSQMQRVKWEDMFNGLMQKTIERILSSSDAGSHAANGSLVSSAKINNDGTHHRGSAFRSSFNPANIKMRLMGSRRGVRQASLSMTDPINSVSHITRRTSGETEIYPIAPKAPSTSAVDLPLLR